MQTPTIIAIIAAAILLILLIYVYFGQLSPTATELDQVREERTTLESNVEQAERRIAELEGLLDVELVGTIHFEPGGASITDESMAILEGLVQRLRQNGDRIIRVEGHTDVQMVIPDFPRVFATNWELSAHRATNTIRALETLGIEPERMHAVGKSLYQPLTDVDDPNPDNRRAEIYLLPAQ